MKYRLTEKIGSGGMAEVFLALATNGLFTWRRIVRGYAAPITLESAAN